MANFPRRYYPFYTDSPQQLGPSYSPYRSQYPPTPMNFGYPPSRPMYIPDYPPPVAAAAAAAAAAPVPPETPKVIQATNDQDGYVINKRYKYFGYTLMFLSVAVLGLEIANVVFTYTTFQPYTKTFVQNSFTAPYILTWVAPGIWGAIIVFISGYLATRVAGKYNNLVRIFALFCSLSSMVFTPAIVGVSIAELVTYPAFPQGDSQPWYNGYTCYNFTSSATLSCPKFILPLIVSILGAIAFYLTLVVTIIFCCCWKPKSGSGQKVTAAAETTEVVEGYYPQPRFPSYPPPANFPMARLPPAQPYFVPEDPVYRPAPRMAEPDMNLLRSYPVYRPAASRGFGFAPAYNRQSYGNFPGTLPSLTSFDNSAPNPAYRVVYA